MVLKKILATTFISIVIFFFVHSQEAYADEINSATAESDSAFMDMVQKACFDFFWNEANTSNGLIRDRDESNSACSIASVGFGLSAICVGVNHGWVSRSAAASRVLKTLQTFWNGPQGNDASGYIGYKGFFYHFLNMNSATRAGTSELSSIDTALLLAGILHAREYFFNDNLSENMIRSLADSIYLRIDWNWMRNYQPNLLLGWSPESGFINAWWSGYNEAMIMNILALGSPTHPTPASTWKAWTGGYQWKTYYGYTYVVFPPLFGHQYSHCWIDFRNIQDEYMRNKSITYFENSRRATLAQREYCIDNPGNFTGYSENIWGLTAGDGPNGYKARGAPPAQNDNGTIAPTAAGGSIVFTPQESLAALRYMYDTYKSQIWKNYGFRDGFNLSQNWWGPDVIGIDEGPIILMMENYRSGSIWDTFKRNEYIQAGLAKAGFETITALKDENASSPGTYSLSQNYPNPFNPSTIIRYQLPVNSYVKLTVYDILGRTVKILVDRKQSANSYNITFDAGDLTNGIYFYKLQAGDYTQVKQMLLIK